MNDKINNDPNTMSYENKEFNNNTKQLNLLTNEITYLYDIIQTQNEKIIDLEISIEKLKHNTETIKTNLKRTDSLRIKNLRSIKKLQTHRHNNAFVLIIVDRCEQAGMVLILQVEGDRIKIHNIQDI